MTSNLTVSIIIPCFNAQEFVGDAIQSALGQTYPHKEVIVIDDGSTDRSLDVIKSFGDAIRWETGPNRGGSAARNRGLALAQGDFIQFLDADDRLLASKLQHEVQRVRTSGADVCLSRFRVIHTDGKVVLSGPKVAPHGDSLEWFLSTDIRLSPLYRSRVVKEAGGFEPSLPCCQDFDLNLQIALAGASYTFAADLGYEFRRQFGSVSSDEIRLYRVMVRVLKRVAGQIKPQDKNREHRIVLLAAKMSSCGRWLLRFGDVEGGLEAFKEAEALDRSGGLRHVYSRPARCVRFALGPVLAERVLWRLRRLRESALTHPCSGYRWTRVVSHHKSSPSTTDAF